MFYEKIEGEVWRCRDYIVTWSATAKVEDFTEGEEVVNIGDLSTGKRPTIYQVVGESKGISGYLDVKKPKARKPYPYLAPSALGKIVKHHTEFILW